MAKIGLVLEGGGMKCAYGAGVLDRFLDEGISFDYVIGVSAGAANGASFVAGQRGRNIRFYTKHLNEKGYSGLSSYLRTGDLFGLDYIYSTLSNSDGADPLDYEKIMKNSTRFEVVATNAITGDPVYFTKESFVKDDYKEIKASSAMPAACKPVYINRMPYFDGGIADPLPIDRAFKTGCDRVVVITSKPRDYVRKAEKHRWFYTTKCSQYPKMIEMLNDHHISYMMEFNHMYDMEKKGEVFVIAPSRPLQLSTFSKDAQANMDIYNLGFIDYEDSKKSLKKFMEGNQ